MKPSIEVTQALDGFDKRAATAMSQKNVFLESLPAFAACPIHPDKQRIRDNEASWVAQSVVFRPCDLCQARADEEVEMERLNGMGVPWNICGATFQNWIATDDTGRETLATVREFAIKKRGFLIFLGDVGTGKSHLATAVIRGFKSGMFITQSELLRRLRQTYRDKSAIDPVDRAQNSGCLVLDDVGLSSGGRDELPLLHDILDHRHGNMKPTILTGNLRFDELGNVIGDRMADRIRESHFAVLTFSGPSRRREARERYFDAPPRKNTVVRPPNLLGGNRGLL